MKGKINYSAKFIEMANRGKEVYYMHALYWLSDAFIRLYDCSKYYTVIYRASEGWAQKLGESTHPLAINAICQPVMNLYPYVNPKHTDKFNTCPIFLEEIPDDEICSVCEEVIEHEIKAEKELCEILCAGLRMALDCNKPMNKYTLSDICFCTDEYTTYYDGYFFKSDNLQNLKLHIFQTGGIMSDFHFVVDFLKFLSTGELHLVYQYDAQKDLKLKGKLCSWHGYEIIAECLKDKFNSKPYPLEEMTFYYIEDLDMKLYRWGKTTVKELMAARGLVPYEKYAKYIERSHQLTFKRAS